MTDVRDRLRISLAEYDAADADARSISSAIGAALAANHALAPTPGHPERVAAYKDAVDRRRLISIAIVEQARDLARLLELGVIP